MRLAVLGGSGSGVPALVKALRASQTQGRLGSVHVRLFGRELRPVEAVCSYIERFVLGDPVATATKISLSAHVHLSEALEDATHIVCLVRAGGMSGRARDEALALAAGVPADEGLGAGGLACFLRGRELIRALASQCRSIAPAAVFLQMSSPLGLNVAITRDAFGPATYGVCELPLVTKGAVMSHVASRRALECVTARCAGLNHQSWLYAFSDAAGRDCTTDVLEAIDRRDLVDIDPETIREYGAVPMPYLRLYLHTEHVVALQRRSPPRGVGLAAWKARLEDAYRCESEAGSHTVDALLAERKMNWFEEGLLPVLEALGRQEETSLTLNLPCSNSLSGISADAIIETDCAVSRNGVRPLMAPVMPPKPFELTQRLTEYERAVLQLPAKPKRSDLADVLSMHPLTPASEVHQLASAMSAIKPVSAH
jgi:6-phospho-beta-glucosidase